MVELEVQSIQLLMQRRSRIEMEQSQHSRIVVVGMVMMRLSGSVSQMNNLVSIAVADILKQRLA